CAKPNSVSGGAHRQGAALWDERLACNALGVRRERRARADDLVGQPGGLVNLGNVSAHDRGRQCETPVLRGYWPVAAERNGRARTHERSDEVLAVVTILTDVRNREALHYRVALRPVRLEVRDYAKFSETGDVFGGQHCD